MPPRLAIVLAVQRGGPRLAEVLAALRPQCDEGVEVLVCAPAGEPVRSESRRETWLTWLEAPAGSLVPHLWRDGILAARAPRVALTVVHCRPEPGWVAALLAADLDRYAAVGGAIGNDSRSDACGWAVYLLRYLRYSPPFQARETTDLPGDNVVYDRARLLRLRDSFQDGFWEPRVHARLAAEGGRLMLDPALAVVHANGYSAGEFARLRFAHGWEFGCDRARAMSRVRRLAYAALGPAIPLVFGAKVARLALRNPVTRSHLPGALPHLAFFLVAWSVGEVLGVLAALVEARH